MAQGARIEDGEPSPPGEREGAYPTDLEAREPFGIAVGCHAGALDPGDRRDLAEIHVVAGRGHHEGWPAPRHCLDDKRLEDQVGGQAGSEGNIFGGTDSLVEDVQDERDAALLEQAHGRWFGCHGYR